MASPPSSHEASIPPQKQKKIPTSVYFFSISLSLLSFSLVFLSFRDIKFWFLFSNAIIFFIAADSDPFSPKPDLYDEFLKHRDRGAYSGTTSSDSTVDTQQETHEKKQTKEVKKPDPIFDSITPTEKVIVAVKEESIEPPKKDLVNATEKDFVTVENQDNVEPLKKDSNINATEKDIVIVKEEINDQGPRDSTSRTGPSTPVSSEEDCFSGISDDELNRRVEEFIRRVNREIRLQEIRER